MWALAETEGHFRARRVESNEWNFDSFTILRPISPWNASKRSNRDGDKIQFSLPKSRMGMIHVSKMVFPDMGFSFPWKAPMAPKAKKALLAFLIATSMAFEAERSQDHQYPRHLAWCCMVRASFPRVTAGVEGEGLDDDTSRTSHLVGFSIRALSAAKVSTVLICSCRVAREVVTVRMSSAWANAPAYVSEIYRWTKAPAL